MTAQEQITRRRLPHWFKPGAAHFLTYRLRGTLPSHVMREWRAAHPKGLSRRDAHKLAFKRYDEHLDMDRSIDWLTRPQIAPMLRENLLHHAGSRYHLLAWCIMPNHAHVLLQPTSGTMEEEPEAIGETADSRSPLSVILHGIKSYTAHEANKLLGRRGPFWQPESYDHWVRDADELERIVAYIANNPVKAGLAEQPWEWPHGSAHDRWVSDGDRSGALEVQPPG